MSKRLRLGLLLGLLASALAVGIWQLLPRQPARTVVEPPLELRVGRIRIVNDDAPLPKIDAVPFGELPGIVAAYYRVRPDRRVLYAAAEIRRLTSGTEVPTVFCRFRDGGWEIRVGSDLAGRLPEIPDYKDALEFLAAWASVEEKRAVKRGIANVDPASLKGLEKDLTEGASPEVLKALAKLNELAKKAPGDSELRRAALRGLLWLDVQTYDDLQLSDPILGSALALRAFLPGDSPREDALLAFELGYEDAARHAAEALPADDADRLFVTRRNLDLQHIAAATRSRRAEYLHLVRFARKQDDAAWFATLEKSTWGKDPGMAALSAALGLRSFRTEMQTSQAAIGRAFEEVFSSRFPDPEPWTPPLWDRLPWRAAHRSPFAHLHGFEKRLANRAELFGGPVVGPDVVEAHYRAVLYSSIHEAARHFFDGLSDTSGAAWFATAFASPPAGTAAELKRWIESRVKLREGDEKGRESVAEDMTRLKNIGVVPLARIRYSIILYSRHKWDPLRRTPMRAYFDALDTRPSNLYEAGAAAWENLRDLARAEKYLRPAAARGGLLLGDRLPWVLSLAADGPALKALVEDENVAPAVRADALGKLASAKVLVDAEVKKMVLVLIAAGPQQTWAEDVGAGFFEKKGELATAEELVRAWLSGHGDVHDLPWAHAATRLARLLRKTGRLEEAWVLIQEAATSGAAGPIGEEVLELLERKDFTEALVVANGLRARYPEGAGEHAVVAEVLWRSGKPEEAAKVLSDSRKEMLGSDWEVHIAPRFVRCFPGKETVAAERAFKAIVATGFSGRDLMAIPDEIARLGNPELAFRLGGMIKSDPATRLALFRFRRMSGEPAAAAEWIRSNTPRPNPDDATLAFQERADELLWDLFSNAPLSGNSAWVHMLRAASLCRSRDLEGARADSLRSLVRPALPGSGLIAMTSFLVGVLDRDGLLARSDSRENMCYVAWGIGLKAASDGHYEEANDWMQVALEAGGMGCVTSGFAWETVWQWTDSGRYLPQVAAARLL